MNNKERLINCHSPEETGQARQFNATWRPGLDSGTEKAHQQENQWKLNKAEATATQQRWPLPSMLR